MGNIVYEGMTIVWCTVPSSGSQGHSSWWPLQLHWGICLSLNVFGSNWLP